MKKYIDESVILTEAKLMYEDYHSIYILIEGETDKKFYSLLHDPSHNVTFRELGGWENVYNVIKSGNKKSLGYIVGIIDRDFHDILNDGVLQTNNLFATDEQDIEMILFKSTSYEKFLKICASDNKLKRILDPRKRIFETANPIGALRLVSLKNSYGLDFDELEYKNFIDRDTLKVNLQSLIHKVFCRTCCKGKKLGVSESKLLEKTTEILQNYSSEQLCTGHDVMEIICITMMKLFATNDTHTYTPEIIFSHLLMGYSIDEFKSSRLFNNYSKWYESQVTAS